ncbi:hypothetical protein SASPL_107832 [Salvia splendens]|uniref:Sugar phosphate transporter domain-containing protein n=1 Tax=Salvia splendens TaxID=180675 RepID=A0A8X9A7N6_SALSN|nr:hypothetical protein SASPL_107832 [Salvia splendens]
MASISNLSLFHQSRSSSFHKLHCTSHRNVHPISNHLEFSPLHKKITSLKTPTLLKLSHRLSDIRLVKAAGADAEGHEIELTKGFVEPNKSFSEKFPALVTGFFFFNWYFLNVIFNILNKKVYNYFPYPYYSIFLLELYTASSAGLSVCQNAPFMIFNKQPINKELLGLLTPVAACHALGHVMSNVSFAAVAVSFTHTIKALEPFFSAAASQFVLGHQIPLPLWLSLAPVVLGVSMASLTELSFNWTGFISTMISNISFTYRSIYSKKAMIEGPQLMQYRFKAAIAKVATNTLERVAPLTHAVGNVLKRVFVIGFSIVVFGNRISTQTGIGTGIAIAGVAIYSLIEANMEEEKRPNNMHLKGSKTVSKSADYTCNCKQ